MGSLFSTPVEVLARERAVLQKTSRQIERARDRANDKATAALVCARNAFYNNNPAEAKQHVRASVLARQSAARLTETAGLVSRACDTLTIGGAQVDIGEAMRRAAGALASCNESVDLAEFNRVMAKFTKDNMVLTAKMDATDSALDAANEEGAGAEIDVADETDALFASLQDEAALDAESDLVAAGSSVARRRKPVSGVRKAQKNH